MACSPLQLCCSQTKGQLAALICVTCDCTDSHRGAGTEVPANQSDHRAGATQMWPRHRGRGKPWLCRSLPCCPRALVGWAVWLSCGLPKAIAELTALKNAILQRRLQKHQKSQMTFQIACGVYFKADERAVNSEPGELIPESPIK